MKRFALIIMTIATIFAQQVHAQYYSVNFDAKTVAAMVAAYGTGTVAEAYYDEQVQNILKHYKASEVATAGIFASKFLERKALTDLGIWSSATENYYYRRIYHLVAHKIIPKTWIVAKLMLRSPQTALHWCSYLMKGLWLCLRIYRQWRSPAKRWLSARNRSTLLCSILGWRFEVLS